MGRAGDWAVAVWMGTSRDEEIARSEIAMERVGFMGRLGIGLPHGVKYFGDSGVIVGGG